MSPMDDDVIRPRSLRYRRNPFDSGITRSSVVTVPAGHVPHGVGDRGHVGFVGDRDHDLASARDEAFPDLVPTARIQGTERVVDQEDGRLAEFLGDRRREPDPQAQRGGPGLAVRSGGPRAQVAHLQA